MVAVFLTSVPLQSILFSYLYIEEWVPFLTLYPYSWRRTATLRAALEYEHFILQVWHAERRERLQEELLHELPEFIELPCAADWFD
jgi:hypothetical protein